MEPHKPLGGRPKKIRKCPHCSESFGARELREHQPTCGKAAAVRGRKPKPIARQISEGDPRQRGKRKLERRLAAEPKTTRGLPKAPKHLTGRARAAWDFWEAELRDMKLDRRPDAMMLEGCCVNYGRAVEADLIVAKEGIMVEEMAMVNDELAVVKRSYHPAIMVSNAAWRQVRAFCSEFGLSPVSRTRLAIEKDESDQDLMAMLAAPREGKPVVQ